MGDSGEFLDAGLPSAFNQPLRKQESSALFDHTFESYRERDTGVSVMAWAHPMSHDFLPIFIQRPR